MEEKPSFSFLKLKEALSKSDEDRNLFMEILLSTRSHLWMSYVNIDAKDGKKTQVSSAVDALNLKEIAHPSLVFSQKTKDPFFKEFYCPSPLRKGEEPQEVLIDLRHLGLLAKHPLQFYFHRTLQIYLEKKEEGDGEFTLSHLNRALLRKSTLTQPWEEVMQKEAKRLPQGAFKKPAMKRISEESEEIFSHFEQWNLSKQEIYSLDLKLGCREPFGEIMPPLRIPLKGNRTAVFFGKLGDLTPQGMVFHGTHHLKDLIKIWPLYLVYLHLPLEGEKKLLLSKNGKTLAPIPNDRELLMRYVDYYELAKTNVSPCMPEWASSLLKGEAKELEKAMRASFESPFFPDPYLAWIAQRDPLPEAKVLIERWTPLMQDLYESI